MIPFPSATMARAIVVTLAIFVAGVFGASQTSEAQDAMWVYIGTYTQGESKGIYRLSFDPATGELSKPQLAAETVSPSFLAVHPTNGYLYAVNEIGEYEGEKTGSVSAFRLDAGDGSLEALNVQPSAGAAPCHIVVDATGKHVLVANYSGGTVAVLPIEEDGRLGAPSDVEQHEGSSINPRRQEAPHAHSINLDSANRFAVAADLGVDKLFIYRFNADRGTLEANVPPFVGVKPGAGPRHFAFHPEGKSAYVINEMESTITAFTYDAELGALEPLQTISTLPADVEGNTSTAEIQVHPSGRFVYGSNRGHDSITIFAVDSNTGRLNRLDNESTRGETPRNFGIDPTGRFLIAANQNSDTLVVFRIDPESGLLEPTGQEAEVPSPVCVKFVPKGS